MTGQNHKRFFLFVFSTTRVQNSSLYSDTQIISDFKSHLATISVTSWRTQKASIPGQIDHRETNNVPALGKRGQCKLPQSDGRISSCYSKQHFWAIRPASPNASMKLHQDADVFAEQMTENSSYESGKQWDRKVGIGCFWDFVVTLFPMAFLGGKLKVSTWGNLARRWLWSALNSA